MTRAASAREAFELLMATVTDATLDPEGRAAAILEGRTSIDPRQLRRLRSTAAAIYRGVLRRAAREATR